MSYDGVLQPWYPAHKYPYLILQANQKDACRTSAMTFYSKLRWQIWRTAGSLKEIHGCHIPE